MSYTDVVLTIEGVDRQDLDLADLWLAELERQEDLVRRMNRHRARVMLRLLVTGR